MSIARFIDRIIGEKAKDKLIHIIVEQRSKKYAKLDPSEYPEELKRIYRKQTRKELRLDRPITYNEKIQWMKLYDNNPNKAKLADKYLMKEFVAQSVGEKYVVPLLGVWDTAEEIDFGALPDKFVLKTNNGCHTNIIVPDKSVIDVKKVKKTLSKWMTLNTEFMNGFEMQYKDIPKKIIAEEFIEGPETGLEDYKVWCFEGKAFYIQYLSDRKNGLRMAFYDRDWRKMPFVYSYPKNTEEILKPSCLEDMLTVAEKLSQGFHHVRVDFYILNDGSLKIGELTFTSAGGTCLWNPEEWDYKLGELIHLPIKGAK